MGIDYAEAQSYVQYYRSKGCNPTIVDNTESIFNLFFFLLSEVDRLNDDVEKKTVNIARLKEMVFGTGNSHNVDEPDEELKPEQEKPATIPKPPAIESEEDKGKEKPKGHGRLAANAYTGASVVECRCDYREGDLCPQCHHGRLKLINPSIKIHIDGQAPLFATRYELERLVCSFCPWITTATAPVDLSKKYTEQSKAVLAYLHYGMGLPFYRLAKMQKMLGIPLPVSTQSDLIESMMGPVHAIFNYLAWLLAQSDLIYQDDTRVKILALIKENLQLNPERKGLFSSGFIGEGEHTIVLFYSGRKHAGENFGEIIKARDETLGPVTRMADALDANSINDPDCINAAKCNSHPFRRFRSLLTTHEEAAKFVLKTYGKIYKHDRHCKDHHFDDDARLAYHQQHSQPLMDQMKQWVEEVLDANETNGTLVKECRYLINHWRELTLFLRIPGVPLDNNRLEAMLKFMICYRKNSLVFKTAYSAEYGSRLISLIVTCMMNEVDAVDYLTQPQCYEPQVWSDPQAWLPWTYQETLSMMSLQRTG